MRTLLYAGALILLLVVSGCKSRPSLVGEWESAGNTPVRITFRDDGTFELKPNGMARNIQIVGKYVVVENKVKMSDMTVDLPEGTPFKRQAENMIQSNSGPNDLTLSWKTDDEIVLDGQGMIRGGFKRVTN